MLTREDALSAARGALKDHVARLTAVLLTEASSDPCASLADEMSRFDVGLRVVKEIDAAVCEAIDEAFPEEAKA